MTKEFLKQQLADMGLKSDDSLMLHSSMKAIGSVAGGADTVIDAFMEYFSDGMFMTPAHTWRQMSDTYNVFDPAVEPACVGIIPNIFMKRENVYRSLHPTHSIAAFGRNAMEYVRGDENFDTPCNPAGCFGRLKDINAKILLAGVTHARNTYIHSIEESFDVPDRFTKAPSVFYVKMPDGNLKEVKMYRHYNSCMAHISESFDKLMDYYFETGAAVRAKLGNADSILCDAGRLYESTAAVLKKDINFFIPLNKYSG
ncbi:MAG: AAC(3) family N-acetyltransferase [Lachnospiraceae bacterium]